MVFQKGHKIWVGRKHSEKAKEKIGLKNRGTKRTETEKENMRVKMKGKHTSIKTQFKKGHRAKHYKPNGSIGKRNGRYYVKYNDEWIQRNRFVYVNENKLGYFFIPKGWEIHHINNNKLDDRIENLVMIPCSMHMSIHGRRLI